MKKKILLAISIMMMFLLTACNNEGTQAESTIDFDFIKHTGVSFENIYNEMGLKENTLIASKGVGRYDYAELVTYDEYEFTKYLMFGKYNNYDSALYGGGYVYVSETKDEACVSMLKELKVDLAEQYGEPSTYPGLPNTIDSIGNIEECQIGAAFKDTWSVTGDKPGEITLSLTVLEKGLSINVMYSVSVTR